MMTTNSDYTDGLNGNDNGEEHVSFDRGERRNNKRFDEKMSARIENEDCIVLNVSSKGVLLQTKRPVYFFPLEGMIDIHLQVEGRWLVVEGKVMWIQSEALNSKIGLFIEQAPEEYLDFLKGLYG